MSVTQTFANPTREGDSCRVPSGRRIQVWPIAFASLINWPPLLRYLRALAALYIRMTFRAVDVYELLEPLLKDYRKLRERNMGNHSYSPKTKSWLNWFYRWLLLGIHGRICLQPSHWREGLWHYNASTSEEASVGRKRRYRSSEKSIACCNGRRKRRRQQQEQWQQGFQHFPFHPVATYIPQSDTLGCWLKICFS